MPKAATPNHTLEGIVLGLPWSLQVRGVLLLCAPTDTVIHGPSSSVEQWREIQTAKELKKTTHFNSYSTQNINIIEEVSPCFKCFPYRTKCKFHLFPSLWLLSFSSYREGCRAEAHD